MKKHKEEADQLDKIEQRIIDLAHQQTLLLTLDNKEIFALLKKAEEEVGTWKSCYEEATKWTTHYSDRAIAWVQTCRRLSADNKALQERGTAIQKVNVKFKRQINKLTEQNKQSFHEMANYKQERDTARADLYLAEQRECVLEENNKLMREALEYYSLKERYFYLHGCLSDISLDGGTKARDALIATGEPK